MPAMSEINKPEGIMPAKPPGVQAPKPASRRPLSPLMQLLVKIALLAVMAVVVLTFVLGVHVQQGMGMYPFIMDGDLLITYKLDPYRVGDAVAYRDPETGETAISRIVAIGENTIQVTDYGELLINGVAPDEKVFYPTAPLEGSSVEYPYIMRKGGYFLLDDYRTEGRDSRQFGQLLKEELLGKVVYVFRRRGI